MAGNDGDPMEAAQIAALLQSLFSESAPLPTPEPSGDFEAILTLLQEQSVAAAMPRLDGLETAGAQETALEINDNANDAGAGSERILAILSEIRALIAERDPEYL